MIRVSKTCFTHRGGEYTSPPPSSDIEGAKSVGVTRLK